MSVSLISRLHEHRLWVNQTLLESARKLSESQRRQTFPMGQGSIWNSLLHFYTAEYVWIESLLGDEASEVPGDLPGELPGNQKGEDLISGGAAAEMGRVRSTLDSLFRAAY
ncbi:DinB family protein [uncultured Gimesia sp.]|uniref:DinB family protein n=1 Tax=uncultured Gimesia sp. TaxID=1678688 RepID=UPI002622F0CB|nr:DinB family protein [uncultured Gimesia sp.]